VNLDSISDSSDLTRSAFVEVVAGVRDYCVSLLNPAGKVLSWNAGAETIYGYRAQEIVGKHYSLFYTSDEISTGWPGHKLQVATSTGRFEDQGWRMRKDGTRFWADTVLSSLRDENGELQGFLKICRDLTDSKQAEEKLRVSEERFRLMVDSVQDYAIFMLDPRGIVTTWNSGAERLKGYQAAEIIGQHFSRFYPQEAIDRGWPDEELRQAVLCGRFEDEGWRLRKDGTPFWANVVLTALRDNLGSLVGYAKVTRDLTERKDTEEQARRIAEEAAARRAAEAASEERQRLVDELKLADQRKDQFLATLAHELRNPLAPLRSGLRVLSLLDCHDEQLQETRQMMERQLSHMVRLVDDLLDMSRISRGKVTLQKQRLTLQSVVEQALEISRPALERAGHQIFVQLPPQPLWVEADLTRLSQVLANLLNNAAKFTPPGGRIQIEGTSQAGEIQLLVSDNGIGIPEEKISEVFDIFTQVSRFQEHSQDGLGIGLSLVKYLVELHGGRVEARSEGKGQGAQFTVHLPAAQSPVEGNPNVAEMPAQSLGFLRVLVVDDNRDAAKMMATLLRILKQEVAQAHDGVQALEVAEQFRPQLILMDIGMPRMNGHEACRALRARDWGREITIAALTGWGQDEDKAHCRESGFDHHFVKPLESGALERLINDLLKQQDKSAVGS
jgi:PAS domain S-box-containing protein